MADNLSKHIEMVVGTLVETERDNLSRAPWETWMRSLSYNHNVVARVASSEVIAYVDSDEWVDIAAGSEALLKTAEHHIARALAFYAGYLASHEAGLSKAQADAGSNNSRGRSLS